MALDLTVPLPPMSAECERLFSLLDLWSQRAVIGYMRVRLDFVKRYVVGCVSLDQFVRENSDGAMRKMMATCPDYVRCIRFHNVDQFP